MFTPFCGGDDVDSMDDIFYGKQDDAAGEYVERLRPPEKRLNSLPLKYMLLNGTTEARA